jgi:hypothetical protein
MATALASLLPAPAFSARQGRDEQHIDALSKRSLQKARQLDKKRKIRPAGADLPPVLRERQSVLVLRKGQLPGIVVPLPQAIRGALIACSISPEAC